MCVMLSWLLTVVLVLLVLISVLGNTLVCVAVKTDNTLRKLSNLFLVSLALADLFVRNSQILRSTDQLRPWVYILPLFVRRPLGHLFGWLGQLFDF